MAHLKDFRKKGGVGEERSVWDDAADRRTDTEKAVMAVNRGSSISAREVRDSGSIADEAD